MLPPDPIVRTVLNMMAFRGGDATVIVPSKDAEYDPATSTSKNSVVNYPVRAIVFDYLQKHDGMGGGSKTLVESGDRQMFLKPSPDLPKLRAKIDSVIWGDRKFTIATCKEMNPTGTNVILYELFIRE